MVIETVADRENDAVEVRDGERVALDDGDIERDPVEEMVVDAIYELLPDEVARKDAVMDGDAPFDERMLPERDTDRDLVWLADIEADCDGVRALVRLELLLTLGERVAVNEGCAIH